MILKKQMMKNNKKEKRGEAANVFFGSFLDTKKELGCGAKPHCCTKTIMKLVIKSGA